MNGRLSSDITKLLEDSITAPLDHFREYLTLTLSNWLSIDRYSFLTG
jgi:hypothetical protein